MRGARVVSINPASPCSMAIGSWDEKGEIVVQKRLWKEGDLCVVAPRTWTGINRLGGHGRISKVHRDENDVIESLDVKYILGGRDAKVPLEFVSQPEDDSPRRSSKRAEKKKVVKKEASPRRLVAMKRPRPRRLSRPRKQPTEAPQNPFPVMDDIPRVIVCSSSSEDCDDDESLGVEEETPSAPRQVLKTKPLLSGQTKENKVVSLNQVLKDEKKTLQNYILDTVQNSHAPRRKVFRKRLGQLANEQDMWDVPNLIQCINNDCALEFGPDEAAEHLAALEQDNLVFCDSEGRICIL